MANLRTTDLEAGQASSSSHPSTAHPPRSRHGTRIRAFNWELPEWLSRHTSASSACMFTLSADARGSLTQKAGNPEGTNRSSKFFYRNETERYPEGLPRLAADQEAYENTALHRKFGYLLQRCIINIEINIARLEQQLFKLDHRMAAGKAQPPDGDNLPTTSEQEEELPNQVSKTLQEISSLIQIYYQMLQNEKFAGSLHEVRNPEYNNRYYKIKNDGYLDPKEMGYLYHPDDFVSTGSDPLWGWLYTLPHFLLFPLLEDRSTKKDKFTSYLSIRLVRAVYETIVIWFYAFLLLLPMLLFVLLPALSKKSAVGVLAGFTIFFTASMALHRGMKHYNMLLGLCAYAAVLGAFLANLQGEFSSR